MVSEIKKKKLSIYESGPIDYFEDFRSIFAASHFLYQEEIEHGEMGFRAADRLHELNLLLFEIMSCAGKYFRIPYMPRGVPLHYAFISLKSRVGDAPVIIHKEDNNGTVYAFSWEGDIEKDIPHEFGCDWELIEVIGI